MSRTAKYDREAIAAMYLADEKATVIASIFGCHESTPGKIVKAMGLKMRRKGMDRDMLEFVTEHIHAPAKRIAEALETTEGYVNKLKCIARKKAAQSI